jgi:hypothetical protein
VIFAHLIALGDKVEQDPLDSRRETLELSRHDLPEIGPAEVGSLRGGKNRKITHQIPFQLRASTRHGRVSIRTRRVPRRCFQKAAE